MTVAFQRHTRLPQGDCSNTRQPTIPHLEQEIAPRRAMIRHPWSKGQVDRMNRRIKEASDRRFHCDNHEPLQTHLADFLPAYDFARRLKTLSELAPYEYACKIWISEPDRFTLNPIQQMPGSNI